MTELKAVSRCHECAALLPDNPDDRRAHLGWHKDVAKKLEAQRARVGALSSDIVRLVNDVAGFRRTLDSHPISAEPSEIIINEIPDDEIDEYEDDQPTSTYLDDITPTTHPTNLDNEDEYPLAIDRDDNLNTVTNGLGPLA